MDDQTYEAAFERRQLERMRLVIDAYLNGSVGLRDLEATLTFLLSHVQTLPAAWIKRMNGELVTLDILIALAVEERRKLNPQEQALARSTAAVLSSLVDEVLQ
jgi:hypothetical protein